MRNPPPSDVAKMLVEGYGKKAPFLYDRAAKLVGKEEAVPLLGFIYGMSFVTEKMKRDKKSPYTEQVFRWVENRSLIIPEDVDKTIKLLTEFHRLKTVGGIKGKDAEPSSYPTQQDMAALVMDLSGAGKTLSCTAPIIARVGEHRVYEITTYEQMEACGSNTNWCVVADKRYFDGYRPPFYLLTRRKPGEAEERVALIHLNTLQWRAPDDSAMDANRKVLGEIIPPQVAGHMADHFNPYAEKTLLEVLEDLLDPSDIAESWVKWSEAVEEGSRDYIWDSAREAFIDKYGKAEWEKIEDSPSDDERFQKLEAESWDYTLEEAWGDIRGVRESRIRKEYWPFVKWAKETSKSHGLAFDEKYATEVIIKEVFGDAATLKQAQELLGKCKALKGSLPRELFYEYPDVLQIAAEYFPEED